MSFGPLEITTMLVMVLIVVCTCVGAYVITRRLVTAIARRFRR